MRLKRQIICLGAGFLLLKLYNGILIETEHYSNYSSISKERLSMNTFYPSNRDILALMILKMDKICPSPVKIAFFYPFSSLIPILPPLYSYLLPLYLYLFLLYPLLHRNNFLRQPFCIFIRPCRPIYFRLSLYPARLQPLNQALMRTSPL